MVVRNPRVPSFRRALTLVAVVALATIALAPAPGHAAGGTTDFGDAPDGASANYTGLEVAGKFPSREASNGPRHNSLKSLFLGPDENGEADSMQVDADLHDDGAQVDLKVCSDQSRLTALVNAAGLTTDKATAANTVYVNAWFDWNRDGDWEDSEGCAREWAIQNLPVSADKVGAGGLLALPVTFKAGPQVTELWWRVQVTLDEPVIDPAGRGGLLPYTIGETEDYFLSVPLRPARPPVLPPLRPPKPPVPPKKAKKPPRPPKKPKNPKKGFAISCNPNPTLVFHGGTAKVKFIVKDTGKGLIYGRVKPRGKGPNQANPVPRKPQPKGLPPGWFAADHFTFKTTKDPPTRIEKKVVTFIFWRGNQSQKLTCLIVVIHIDLAPPVICKDRCTGDPGPPVAINNNFTGSWRKSSGMPAGSTISTEMIGLSLQCVGPLAGPVSGVRITPGAQTPPWPTAEVDPNASFVGAPQGPKPACKLTAPQGGPPSLDCSFPEAPTGGTFSSFFHVYPGFTFSDTTKVQVDLLNAGQPFGRVEAPLQP